MLAKKSGLPQEEELVLCTVTSVQYHSVFVKIDEYDKVGMIHISEVAPGRIRNIREFVQEGKKIVCKVLRVNHERGHIDLSLRRVNEGQRRGKLEELKQEQLAEGILKYVSKKMNKPVEEIHALLSKNVMKDYSTLYAALEAIAFNTLSLETAGVEKALAKELTAIVQSRIKPPEIKLKGELKAVSYAPDGVHVIKEALAKAAAVPGTPAIKYKGGGVYTVEVVAEDPKKAEKTLKQTAEAFQEFLKKHKTPATFERIEA